MSMTKSHATFPGSKLQKKNRTKNEEIKKTSLENEFLETGKLYHEILKHVSQPHINSIN